MLCRILADKTHKLTQITGPLYLRRNAIWCAGSSLAFGAGGSTLISTGALKNSLTPDARVGHFMGGSLLASLGITLFFVACLLYHSSKKNVQGVWDKTSDEREHLRQAHTQCEELLEFFARKNGPCSGLLPGTADAYYGSISGP